mgnify:FL=1
MGTGVCGRTEKSLHASGVDSKNHRSNSNARNGFEGSAGVDSGVDSGVDRASGVASKSPRPFMRDEVVKQIDDELNQMMKPKNGRI